MALRRLAGRRRRLRSEAALGPQKAFWRSWAPIALLAVLNAAPALADPPTAYDALHFPAVPQTAFEIPVGVIQAGDLPIALERTTLKAVQRRFGGALYHGGDAAEAVTWICYSKSIQKDASLVYWFISNGEMGGGTAITQVAIQRIATAPDKRCGPEPARLTGVKFSLPSIGARLEDVERHFHGGQLKDGSLNYGNTRSVGAAKDPDTTTSQTVQYHFTDGAADIVSVGQVTAD
jgi:hypothetical protein